MADCINSDAPPSYPSFSETVESNELQSASKSSLEVEEENDEDDDNNEEDGELPPMEKDNRQHQHIELIKKLRLQLRDLERYAHQRGELDQLPPSVLAERQSVIIDTIKDKLSLNIGTDKLEKLELNELKKQVDKEIHDLIDPLINKDHLLNQLKTQLTDMERYIEHLHGALGQIHDKKSCSCHLHGCVAAPESKDSSQDNNHYQESPNTFLGGPSLMNNEALPKTSRLIRSLVTQLICSDLKIQESIRKEKELSNMSGSNKNSGWSAKEGMVITKQDFNDGAAWSLHLDKVILATDSLVNLFNHESQNQRTEKSIDESLVELIVRRQLVPALRDLLSYGLIDPSSIPRSTSYAALIFNPYYLLSSLTCFPSSQKPASSLSVEKIHVWNVIEEYYKSRNEPGFKTSSVKTLSQSFNLEPSNSGPLKITSKQALLIAVEDIIETLSKCKPNGPESHFRSFIYTALNRTKLQNWLRIIFKNRSVVRRFYHNFSFASQPDKMDKLMVTIEPLNQLDFKLRTDVESIEQFVNAF